MKEWRLSRDSARTTAEEQLGTIFRVQRECMCPRRRKSGEFGDHAVGGEVESHDV